jgi:hypothetical protein
MGYGSYVAAAAEISVTGGDKIKIHRIVGATDPGHTVNPAQIDRGGGHCARAAHAMASSDRPPWLGVSDAYCRGFYFSPASSRIAVSAARPLSVSAYAPLSRSCAINPRIATACIARAVIPTAAWSIPVAAQNRTTRSCALSFVVGLAITYSRRQLLLKAAIAASRVGS